MSAAGASSRRATAASPLVVVLLALCVALLLLAPTCRASYANKNEASIAKKSKYSNGDTAVVYVHVGIEASPENCNRTFNFSDTGAPPLNCTDPAQFDPDLCNCTTDIVTNLTSCNYTGQSGQLTLNLTACLNVTSNSTKPYPLLYHEKTLFYPTVDELSQLTVIGSDARYRRNTDIVVWVEVRTRGKGVSSSRKKFATSKAHVAFYSAAVSLSVGKVRSVNWDEGCHRCGTCISSFCGVKYSAGCTKSPCNIIVYLAWQGRDDTRTPCQSAGLLPSNFESYSLEPTYLVWAGRTDESWV